MPPKKMLTDEQIATQYFLVPPILMRLAFDEDTCKQFGAWRRQIQATGGELYMIGWPDGTTMTYQAHQRGDLIDIECITEIYKAAACLKAVMS